MYRSKQVTAIQYMGKLLNILLYRFTTTFHSLHVTWIAQYQRPVVVSIVNWGRRGRDRMVVGFATTYAIIAYHHSS